MNRKITLLFIFLAFLQLSLQAQNMHPYLKQDKKYDLVSFANLKMAVPKKAYIVFQEKTYMGSAGCNGMGGQYKLNDYKLKLHTGFSTMMACPDMSKETKFRELLESTNNYLLQNERLILRKDEKELLIFK